MSCEPLGSGQIIIELNTGGNKQILDAVRSSRTLAIPIRVFILVAMPIKWSHRQLTSRYLSARKKKNESLTFESQLAWSIPSQGDLVSRSNGIGYYFYFFNVSWSFAELNHPLFFFLDVLFLALFVVEELLVVVTVGASKKPTSALGEMTKIRFFSSVVLLVSGEVVRLCKPRITNVTNVRFLSSVAPLVIGKVRRPCKSRVTDVAHIRSLSSLDSLVSFKVVCPS